MGVALAAGAGTRLRPLTTARPKPLCPVGDRTLLDHALGALARAVPRRAVNVHHGRDQIEEHLRRTYRGTAAVHVSVEPREALGTAGALAHLRDWVDGRSVLVVNADTYHRADLRAFAQGWDGERVRILTSGALPFGPRSGVVASILPAEHLGRLGTEPSGLWERVWAAELKAGRLDAVHEPGVVVDCGTPADYLRANMVWSGGRSVVGAGAVVEGYLERSVVWPGERVGPRERLVDAIRYDGRTVLVR